MVNSNEDSDRSGLIQTRFSASSSHSTKPNESTSSSHQRTDSTSTMDFLRLPNKYETYAQPVLAEFFGQLIFAFLHCSTANTISVSSGVLGNALLPAVSDGLTVLALVIIIGKISGCHVNFAVTVGVALGGGMKLVMVPLYLIGQLSGSLAGAGIARFTSGTNSSYGQFDLGAEVDIGQGLVMEIMLTTFLVLVVLMAAVELSAVHAAFAIGFAILIDIMAGFNITGGCMNPTLSFGPAVVAGEWTNHWIYWVGPIGGAIIAAFIFRIFLGEKSRLIFQSAPSSMSKPREVKIEQGVEKSGARSP